MISTEPLHMYAYMYLPYGNVTNGVILYPRRQASQAIISSSLWDTDYLLVNLLRRQAACCV